MKKTVFIEGMSCHHCQSRVEKAFANHPSVSQVVVDLANKSATLTLVAELSEQKITEIVDDAGYDVIKID